MTESKSQLAKKASIKRYWYIPYLDYLRISIEEKAVKRRALQVILYMDEQLVLGQIDADGAPEPCPTEQWST